MFWWNLRQEHKTHHHPLGFAVEAKKRRPMCQCARRPFSRRRTCQRNGKSTTPCRVTENTSGSFHKPHSWMICFTENPKVKWMIWGYLNFRKPPHVWSLRDSCSVIGTLRSAVPCFNARKWCRSVNRLLAGFVWHWRYPQVPKDRNQMFLVS